MSIDNTGQVPYQLRRLNTAIIDQQIRRLEEKRAQMEKSVGERKYALIYTTQHTNVVSSGYTHRWHSNHSSRFKKREQAILKAARLQLLGDAKDISLWEFDGKHWVRVPDVHRN
jgi:hypothetical protein